MLNISPGKPKIRSILITLKPIFLAILPCLSHLRWYGARPMFIRVGAHIV